MVTTDGNRAAIFCSFPVDGFDIVIDTSGNPVAIPAATAEPILPDPIIAIFIMPDALHDT